MRSETIQQCGNRRYKSRAADRGGSSRPIRRAGIEAAVKVEPPAEGGGETIQDGGNLHSYMSRAAVRGGRPETIQEGGNRCGKKCRSATEGGVPRQHRRAGIEAGRKVDRPTGGGG